MDLLIVNGTVIDPSQHIFGSFDVGINNGRMAGIFQPGSVPEDSAKETIDASGCLVTPGLIDLHTHVFEQRTALGINADHVGVEQGVTSIVDAGSTGCRDFRSFLRNVVEKNQTRVLLWINIASQGLCDGLSELSDLSMLKPAETEELIKQYPLIRGIKARMSRSVVKENGIKPLLIAKKLAQKTGLPLMVHIGNSPPGLGDILDLLDRGDVVTHAFHGKRGGILDEDGHLIPEADRALKRGVLFDVGHGSSSFSFQTMKRAKELQVFPHTISTDIYRGNVNGPVFSLVMTMAKCLSLGFPLSEVIEASTWTPAKVLGLSDEIGTLKKQNIADVTILKRIPEPVTLVDSENQQMKANSYLKVKYTIKSGKVWRHD
ncbi:amidohydrolase/deacetylase family metallohydrolase [Paenactinomyces guangxiensis]|uniref:Amidohydrolase/deacetylase family metallohydrolase n=1 Tax=Paenactinomyces guangxiensis TaxID=1490290 RepID=A0A7W1WQ85_9BACL|nr:amidohydrolase/deacetylase family metallohydrolase [Paenactinomyces guangxiensis]MBA4493903.1 amidohydrolase/deacetylase family metallohydrolase [Paenactinomyces guangxiensis]MBH8591369.1 amidohydrolase/deacetylase family metallohydrolase [Paenactinomyces guangxiensis]